MKQYRFFYHYNKQHQKMTIHFKKTCHIVDNVVCLVPCNTKWNKRQPKLVMQGFASNLELKYGEGILS